MSPINDDNIDLFELFQVLWNGKWIISTFMAVCISLGGGLTLIKDKEYESKIFFSINTIPPFHDASKALTDFQKRFYSESVFEEWKKNNENISLVFEDFSTIQVLDGVILSKGKHGLLATLDLDNGHILVKTNKFPLLNDFYNYATHINELLRDEYIFRANEELKNLETRFANFSSADNNIVEIVISFDSYIASANQGNAVFFIERPLVPQKITLLLWPILALSTALGGCIGAAYVLILNAIKMRREFG